MSTVHISLPEEIRAFIEAQMAAEGFSSASEYLLTLLREEQRRLAKKELGAKLLEGLQGAAVEMTPEDWDSIEREAQERIEREQARS